MALLWEMRAYMDPSLEKGSGVSSTGVLLFVSWPGAFVLESLLHFWGPLSLRRSAAIAGQFANHDGNHKSTRKWSHNSNWNDFRKAFHEAAGTENHYRQGLNQKQWKTLYLITSCHNIRIKRINLVGGAVCCSRWAEEGLGLVEYSEHFNRLILASLFNTLSSVPVG